MGCHDTVYRIDFLSEKIARNDGVQIRVDERAPGYRRLTGRGLRAGGDARLAKNGAHGRGSDPKSKLLELTDYSPVPPVGIALSNSLY